MLVTKTRYNIFHALQKRVIFIPSLTRHLSSKPIASPESSSSAEANHQIIDNAPNFAKTQSTRPNFDPSHPVTITKQPNPTWTYGTGTKDPSPHKHLEIDPYAPTRPMINNYRLLISAIAPRPIGFISTISSTGTKNLAPMSYFQVIDHDPPMFVIGFSSRREREKDTFRNLKETGECVINTVSEDMIEAVNATSIDAPYGVSEWEVSGLTEGETSTVGPGRVRESVVSIEAKVVDVKELGEHRREGMSVAGVVMVKATRFWVREDATNEDVSHVNLEKLRPVGQLGGMAYGRVTETFEVPRKRWADEMPSSKVLSELDRNKLDV